MRVVVIGAGPAGLMAAIAAAHAGARVTVLERLERPGAKLLASGGGRCNLTNTLPRDRFMAAFGRHGRFLEPALRALDADGLRAFLADRGVPTAAEDGFHVFPVSQSARDVLHALLADCERLGVALRYRQRVEAIHLEPHGVAPDPETDHGGHAAHGGAMPRARADAPARVTGVGVAVDGDGGGGDGGGGDRGGGGRSVPGASETLPADAVILATGGRGYPGLGGSDTGYELARALGHAITPTVPGMVPLQLDAPWIADLAGLVLPDAALWIDRPKRRKAIARGAVLLTHQGLSGPAVLDLSATVAALLASEPAGDGDGAAGIPVRLRLDAARDRAAWETIIADWPRAQGKKTIRALLRAAAGAAIPGKLLDQALRDDAPASPASPVSAACPVSAGPSASPPPRDGAGPEADRALDGGETRAAEWSNRARERLLERLAGWPLTVRGTRGFDHAMVTRGGVDRRGVDPRTLASRHVRGLYLAGEVLDLDGPCGGYNLQWACSSGLLAGRSAATA